MIRNSRLQNLAAFLFIAAILLPSSGLHAQRDIRSIVVEDTLLANPRTPIDMLRAVRDLINVGEHELAKDFIQKTIDAKLNQEQLLDLNKEMGSSFFLRIQRIEKLAPAGRQLTQMVTTAAKQSAQDPKVIAKLINAARSKDDDVRRSARNELTRIVGNAVPQLITEINNEKRADENLWLFRALASLGEPAVPPLVAALSSNDPGVAYQALSALRYIPSDNSLPFLFRPYFDEGPLLSTEARRALEEYETGLPTRKEATAILQKRVHKLLTDPLAIGADLDGKSTVWWWDRAGEKIVSRRISNHDKALLRATWLARDLYRIDSSNPKNREYYLLTQLGWNKTRYGMDRSLPDELFEGLEIGRAVLAPELDDLLSRAMELKLTPSALGAIECLGRMNSLACVGNCGDRIRTLIDALRHPEHRIRFAAAKAILRLDPQQPFGGASDLMDVLGQTLGSHGQRKVLVIHNRLDQGDQMLGSLVGLGFETALALNGKQASRILRSDPDIELILLSETVGRPQWRELLQQLEHDYHSRNLPICLIAREQRLGLVEDVAIAYDNVDTFPIPHDGPTMANLLRRVLPKTSRFATNKEDRLAMANQALKLLEPIASNRTRYSFYELLDHQKQLIEASSVPELAANSARVLGGLGTPAAQSALLDMAGQSYRNVDLRKIAASEFDRSIRQSGVMLRHGQLLAQYDHYNEVIDTDEVSAEVLSDILDSIERLARQN
ncbi:MAG: hypothetical protein AAF497_00545 [Planctomycetota bacterium]